MIVLIILSSLGWLLSVLAVISLSGVGLWSVLGIWLCLIVVFGVTLRRALSAGSEASSRLHYELAADLDALRERRSEANSSARAAATRRI
ncbi:hypothetical protein EG244_11530 [Falsigemmobacter faecalis]|uniref:DUF4229 domain-containing protein n=1 Tax=Falsigemmobacter faecalis TaxID=2488730 RepID=A0A3P3DI75_9RHOB|nr:hypothetical protein EG244_11530 [Falsigemmobacter faecalis]